MVKHNLGTPSGARQQLGIAKPKAKAKALELSELGRFFAREYATGRMRATKVGDGAASASSSAGQAAPDIARFAKAAAPKRGDVKKQQALRQIIAAEFGPSGEQDRSSCLHMSTANVGFGSEVQSTEGCVGVANPRDTQRSDSRRRRR